MDKSTSRLVGLRSEQSLLERESLYEVNAKMKLRVCSLAAMVCLFAGGAAAQSCVQPPSGLIAWWPAEGNFNDVVGGFNGSQVGNVSFVPGQVGQSFHLDSSDGVDYVQVADNATLEPATVTVAAWTRATASPGGALYLVSKGGLGCSHSSYALYTGGGGGLTFYIGFSNVGGGAFQLHAGHPPSLIWDGNWHFVAGTYDGQSQRLYVDGVLVGQSNFASPTAIAYGMPTNDDLLIGQYAGFAACSLPFSGDMDETQIYNRALTQAEIQGIHQAGQGGFCTTQTVNIDIKPGSDPNSISCSSAGVIPVAVLSSDTFDAASIDPLSVDLNGARVKVVGNKNAKPLCHLEDVNADGRADMVCQVMTVDFLIEPGEDMATLNAKTTDGKQITGKDFVRIVQDGGCTP